MDVPKGVVMKPPRVSFISIWRLLIFGIIKTSHSFQQWSLSSNFAKDKDLTPWTSLLSSSSRTQAPCSSRIPLNSYRLPGCRGAPPLWFLSVFIPRHCGSNHNSGLPIKLFPSSDDESSIIKSFSGRFDEMPERIFGRDSAGRGLAATY